MPALVVSVRDLIDADIESRDRKAWPVKQADYPDNPPKLTYPQASGLEYQNYLWRIWLLSTPDGCWKSLTYARSPRHRLQSMRLPAMGHPAVRSLLLSWGLTRSPGWQRQLRNRSGRIGRL